MCRRIDEPPEPFVTNMVEWLAVKCMPVWRHASWARREIISHDVHAAVQPQSFDRQTSTKRFPAFPHFWFLEAMTCVGNGGDLIELAVGYRKQSQVPSNAPRAAAASPD